MSKLLKSKILLGVLVVAVVAVVGFTLNVKSVAADCSITSTLRVGSTGTQVVCLQTALGGLTADGVFGPLTKAAVVSWQAKEGLVADGIFGPKSNAVWMANAGNSANFPAGCVSSVGFSSTTGAACYAITSFPAGCNSNSGYSATTGLSCAGISSSLPAGCTTTAGFSPTTGALCSVVSSLPAGCSSTAGYSPTTGALCSVVSSLPAGCSSTAGYSPTTGAVCTGGSVSTNTGPLAGGAGDAILTHYATSEKSTISEGASNVKVLGFRVEAVDSDIALQNVKVTITNTDALAATNPSSYRLDRYLDSVDIYMGSTKVGSANVADFTKDSANLYSKSITLSNAVVRNGDKSPFYVVFNAASSMDTANNDASLTVTVDSYRFQDATGVIMTNNADIAVTNNVTIDATADALTLLSSSNNPDTTTITVDESNTTDEVLALAFKLKAGTNSSDITLDTLPITVTIASAGSTVTSIANIIDSVVVKIGSKTITADEPTPTTLASGAGHLEYTADFSNEGVVISAGETIEAKVYITFTEQGGLLTSANYADGLTIVTASIDGANVTAESNNTDTLHAGTGTQTGAHLTLSTSANTLSNVSSRVDGGATAGYVEFLFTVAANNGAYNLTLASLMANDVVTGTATTIGGDTPANSYATATPVLSVASGDPAAVYLTNQGFTIADGSTTNFSLFYSVTGSTGQIAQVKITSIAGQEVPVAQQNSPRLLLN